jgi:hypothetical protein
MSERVGRKSRLKLAVGEAERFDTVIQNVLAAEFDPAPDKATVSMGERIDQIASLERVIASVQARQLVVMNAFAGERCGEHVADGAPIELAGRQAAREIALAQRVSPITVTHQLVFADTLAEGFPKLLDACIHGSVSLAAAWAVVDETTTLTQAQRRRIDAEVTADAQELTPGRLRAATRTRVIAADPDAAAEREHLARAKANVRILTHPDGVGTLAALLPAEQAVACFDALDNHARGMRADGDERPIAQLMADTLVERITGITKATGIGVEVGVVIAASSLLGETAQPGLLNGYGAITPHLARRLAAGESVFGRRLVCDPIDGQLIWADTHRRCFDGVLRRYLHTADQTCRMPVCGSPIRDLDHICDHQHGGPTNGHNGQGLCRGCHITKHSPGWSIEIEPALNRRRPTLTWITPTGHRYHSRPPPTLGPGSINHRQPPQTSPLETQLQHLVDDAA